LAASDAQRAAALNGDNRPATLLIFMRWALLELLRERIEDRPLLGTDKALMDYLRATMANAQDERVRVLFLNSRKRLIRDEEVFRGTVDQAPFYVREVARLSLEAGASGVIVVHNHPSGDVQPSRADRSMTRELVVALQALNIRLVDHVIVGLQGTASFRAMGLL
jgi:DNA repair protein RadC